MSNDLLGSVAAFNTIDHTTLPTASTAQLSPGLNHIFPIATSLPPLETLNPPPSFLLQQTAFHRGPSLGLFIPPSASHPLQRSLLRTASLNSNTPMTLNYMSLSLNSTYHSMSKNLNNVSPVVTRGSLLMALPLTLTIGCHHLRYLAGWQLSRTLPSLTCIDVAGCMVTSPSTSKLSVSLSTVHCLSTKHWIS